MSHMPEAMKPSESRHFPPSGSTELKHLREIAAGREVDIIPIGNLGYLVNNRKVPYVAEAPLLLIDWDETSAQTSQDKQRCFKELEGLGVSENIINFCDKFNRVDVGHDEVMHEVELEMRLFSQALLDRKDGKVDLTDDVKGDLERLKAKILDSGSIDDVPVLPEVLDIFKRTRYTSTLFPDTLSSIRALREIPGSTPNIALLTWSDPAFSLERSLQILDSGDVSQIFLTISPKGKFFKGVLEQNPYKDIHLSYKFDDTPRNVGVDFKNWQVPIILFDDDPKQVVSFNNLAEEEGLAGLAVVRIRRPGLKYSNQDVDVGKLAKSEIPNSYLDASTFQEAMGEITDRMLENYLIIAIKHGGPEALSVPDVAQIVAVLSIDRKTDPSIIRAKALAAAKSNQVHQEEET